MRIMKMRLLTQFIKLDGCQNEMTTYNNWFTGITKNNNKTNENASQNT